MLRPKKVLRPIFWGVETHFTISRTSWDLFLDSMGGGAWPFLFGEVICLVNSFSERDLSLLNSVQHDSYLTTSYKDTVCVT